MERHDLESAAVRSTYLRGLLAVPAGLVFIVVGLGNLGWGPLSSALVFLGCLALMAGAWLVINRYYAEHYGRVRLADGQQVRLTIASFLCLGVPMIGGTILDLRLDLPVSLFAILFGVGMLAWYRLCVGLRTDHVLVFGALIVVGLLPLWGGLEDRASAGWLPIGVATIIVGILDHRALARAFGGASDRVGV
ncbi:hypothetical protein [Nocardioides sp.]|uniref:hypothetical protein n=1 Tax=Nocardioides sp. TaxID=35761 RepID=UPI0031FEC9DB|nr:hypothetical protein [Nocardioides sp.]